MRKLVFLAFFAGLSLADPASATIIKLINFDDLPVPDSAPYAHIPNPWAGFDWSPHFMYLEGGAGYLYPGGYQNFDLSAPTNVAFNGGGRNGAPPPPVNFSRRMPFELDSFDLAAAWRDGLEVTVTGELCSPPASPQTCVVVGSTTLTVDESGPTLENFNWGEVNKVVFQSVPGSGVPVGFTDGFQFVLGNVRFNKPPVASTDFASLRGIPEPSTWALMLLGFAGFAAYTRSKKDRLALRAEWRMSAQHGAKSPRPAARA
jgi:PEP-CTERM motif